MLSIESENVEAGALACTLYLVPRMARATCFVQFSILQVSAFACARVHLNEELFGLDVVPACDHGDYLSRCLPPDVPVNRQG
jgi:hypothetical protein